MRSEGNFTSKRGVENNIKRLNNDDIADWHKSSGADHEVSK